MDPNFKRQVSSDRPLNDPKDDRLGYAPFANQMAESLVTMIPVQGLVVALYGAWGAGKSTCLAFIEHYLRRSENDENQLTIVKFNPWWFSGQQDLAMQFFNQLLATLFAVNPESKDLRNRLADFAQLVSKLPIPYAWTGEAAWHAGTAS